MKKLLAVFCLLAVTASAQLPVNHNSVTSDVTKVKGDFNGFNWKWLGFNTQSNSFYIKQGATWVDLTGLNLAYKMSQNDNSGVTTYISSTNVTIVESNVTFTVNSTNIPPNGSYLFEVFAWENVATNPTATLAQGKVKVNQSLYQAGDDQFPWPDSGNLTDYTTLTAFNAHTQNFATAHIVDAPSDGTQYARKDAGWEAVSGGGGTTNTLAEVLAAGNVAGTNINMGFSQILNLGTPTVAGSAATKSYVDSATNNAIIDATNRVAGVGYITAPPPNDVTTTNIAQNITTTNITASGAIKSAGSVWVDSGLTRSTASALVFGDGDSGIRENGVDDQLRIFHGDSGGFGDIIISSSFFQSERPRSFYMAKYNYGLTYPIYSFVGDTDTGLSSTNANEVYIVAGGVKILESTSTGVEVAGTLTQTYDSTNSLTRQWWAISNRWADVQVIGTTTNVTFVSPAL